MTIVTLPFLLMLLFGAHAIADYGLQSRYMAESKVPGSNPDWPITLFAHCMIHSFLVMAVVIGYMSIMGAPVLTAMFMANVIGWAEFMLHFVIDYNKGKNRVSYRMDQCLHYACKIVWLGIICCLRLPF